MAWDIKWQIRSLPLPFPYLRAGCKSGHLEVELGQVRAASSFIRSFGLLISALSYGSYIVRTDSNSLDFPIVLLSTEF